MEGRDKQARSDSLSELRRLRSEGGSRLQAIAAKGAEEREEEDSSEGDGVQRGSGGLVPSRKAAPATRDVGGVGKRARKEDRRAPKKGAAAPPVGAAFRQQGIVAGGNASSRSRADAGGAAAQDAFFKSLISGMDDELSSEEEEPVESGEKACSTAGPPPEEWTAQPSGRDAALHLLSSEYALPDDFLDDALLDETFNAAASSLVGEGLGGNAGSAAAGLPSSVGAEMDSSPPHEAQGGDRQQRRGAHLLPVPCRAIEPIEIETQGATAMQPLADASASTAGGDEGDVLFYFLDAFEKRENGTVYLFGKVAQGPSAYVSCCVVVSNIKRNVFFLPRERFASSATAGDGSGEGEGEEVTLKDVYEEIGQVATAHRINRFGCKSVSRKYAFEVPGVPSEADYFKMVYSFDAPQLPSTLSGRSFSHVFGSNTSALELLLIKRKIMGPSWLRLRPKSIGPKSISWCKVEVQVDSPKDITPLLNGPDAPPLTALSISLRTVVNKASRTHEIVAASALLYNSILVDGGSSQEGGESKIPKCNAVLSVVRDTANAGFTDKFREALSTAYGAGGGSGGRLEVAKNERALLTYLVAVIHRCDPDVLVGHNFLGFDLAVLLGRMRACKVDNWSRLGRLNWSQWPKARGAGSTEASFGERQITSGRVICDTYISARDLVRSKDYSLQTLVETHLAAGGGSGMLAREPIDWERIGEYFEGADALAHLLRHCERDALFVASLMFKFMVLMLTKQLTNIAGNLWARTLVGGPAERNEYLLLHEFHNAKFICPDKANAFASSASGAIERDPPSDQQRADDGDAGHGEATAPKRGGEGSGAAAKRKPAYEGGLVLEPKKGLYENIVILLDFNSLYPSIIQEFNICFTTVERESDSTAAALPEAGSERGVLPRILATLVARRRQIKSMMKDPKLAPAAYAQLHIRQQALKLTANSMYGCLGFSFSRFYARPLAVLVTGKGREILQNTVDVAREVCNLDVIYGDTDSVMVHTGSRDRAVALEMAQALKKAVNERYRLLEIELDGMFERLLLLKKKKYAAVIAEEQPGGGVIRRIETKGLDLVRRDWCALSGEASAAVLEAILCDTLSKDGVLEKIQHILTDAAEDVADGRVALDKFIINKNLAKDPEQYGAGHCQPHVAVALRMRARGMALRGGDTVPYIVCKSATGKPSSSSLADHAFHPEEVAKEALEVDTEWYLAQQVHPCVSRLCEHLEGMSSGQIATLLGLDGAKYHGGGGSHQGGGRREDGLGGLCDGQARLSTLMSEEERFQGVRPLSLRCSSCGVLYKFTGLLSFPTAAADGGGGGGQPAVGKVAIGTDCTACHARISPTDLYYQMNGAVRSAIAEYYEGWMECDEAACGVRTRQVCMYDTQCPADSCRGTCRPMVTGQSLYDQLQYFRTLLDAERIRKLMAVHAPSGDGSLPPAFSWRAFAEEYASVRAMLNGHLQKCSYPIIRMHEIFSFMAAARGAEDGLRPAAL